MTTLDERLAAAGFPAEPSGMPISPWTGPRPDLHLLALRVSLTGDLPSWVEDLPFDVELALGTEVRLLALSLSQDAAPG